MTKTVTLGEIIEKPISGEWGEEGSRIKVLRSTNFTNEGYLNLSDVVTRDIPEKKVQQKKLIPGDIIIEKSGGSPNQPVGRVVYFNVSDEDFLFSNFTSVIRPKAGIYPRFLFWFLFGNHLNKQTLNYQNKTTGIINLQLQRYIDETSVPLPPLPEQRRIAALLDRADALRQKDRQLLAHYDKLAQSIFLDLFGDPVKNEKGWTIFKLSEVLRKPTQSGLYVPPESYSKVDGIEMVHMSDAFYGKVQRGNLKRVLITDKEAIKYAVTNNDLLIARRSLNYEGSAKPCLISEHKEPLVFESSLIKISPDLKKLIPIYIHFFLNNDDARKNYVLKYVTQSTISGINNSNLNKVTLPVPPLSLQTHFAQLIEQIERQKSVVRQQMAASGGLFGRLLQESFGG